MAPRFRLLGWVVLLAGAGMLTVELGQTRAQTLNEGWDALDRAFSKQRGRILGFLKGGKFSPDDNSDVEAIDLLAKTYTYGVYLQKQPDKIKDDFKNFAGDVDGILKAKDREAMQPLAGVLRDKVRIRALDVLQLKEAQPIHKLHNARVLAKIAELGQGKLADTLITVLKDPQQNDGVRYYMLKGLATLLAQVQPMTTTPVLTKDEQAKCAEALVEFLEQKKGPAKNAAPEEIDGFRLLRREAVRALAKIHTPAVNDKVRPALVLARFAGNDARIQPPPRIDERMEAAIGLARMQSAQDKQYQPDYAAGQIAKCLGTFALMVKNERANLREKKEMQMRPWSVDAAMLKDALAALKTDSGTNAFVSQVADKGAQLLDKISSGRGDVSTNDVTWWNSSQTDPPSKELFQGAADTVVKPAPPAEAAPEK